jgi:hypothetical protein
VSDLWEATQPAKGQYNASVERITPHRLHPTHSPCPGGCRWARGRGRSLLRPSPILKFLFEGQGAAPGDLGALPVLGLFTPPPPPPSPQYFHCRRLLGATPAQTGTMTVPPVSMGCMRSNRRAKGAIKDLLSPPLPSQMRYKPILGVRWPLQSRLLTSPLGSPPLAAGLRGQLRV